MYVTSSNGSAGHGHDGHVTIEGTIQTRNERGIQVDGRWLNLSRFRPVELPPVGSRIRVEMDNRGFICSLDVLEAATPAVMSHFDERSETITRLAVLKAAAAFVGQMAQMHEDARSEHVIPLAEKWLAWVKSPKEEF